MKLIYNNQLSDTSNRADLYRIERLNSLGIIWFSPIIMDNGRDDNRQDSYVVLNTIGKKYARIIFADN